MSADLTRLERRFEELEAHREETIVVAMEKIASAMERRVWELERENARLRARIDQILMAAPLEFALEMMGGKKP